jgi:transposase InsO family protein
LEYRSKRLSSTTCLSAIGLPKSTWYYWKDKKVSYQEKYGYLREAILDIAREHPAYGYRRIIPELQERGYPIGEYVVSKMLSYWGLELMRSIKKPKPSGPRQYLQAKDGGWSLVKELKDPAPFQVWYTDFTEIPYAGGNKKAYFMPILDHRTKFIAGWGIGKRRNTAVALDAFKLARGNLEDMGISLEERFIHHGQDSVCTGYRWLQALLIDVRAKVSFSENGAKGNTFMESFNGHFKGENGSLFHDAANIWKLKRAVGMQVEYYNVQRRHSALGYLAPRTYIKREASLPEPILDKKHGY